MTDRATQVLHQVNEIAAKRRIGIRNHKLRTIITCPKFYKKVGTACIHDTPDEARRISFRRRFQWKRKTRNKLNALLAHRARSLAYRANVFGKQTQKVVKPGDPQEFLAVVKHARTMKTILASRAAKYGIQGTAVVAQGTSAKGKKGLGMGVPSTVPASAGEMK